MKRTVEQILSRIAQLQARGRDNGRIVKKLQRELRKLSAN